MITSAAEFERLRTSEKPEEYDRAHLEEAPEEVWLEVIRDYPGMRTWVAHNRTVSVDVLRILARDADWDVRHRVAMKRKTHRTPDLIEHFSRDVDEGIRLMMARSPNVKVEILERLSADTDEWVRLTAEARLRGEPAPDSDVLLKS